MWLDALLIPVTRAEASLLWILVGATLLLVAVGGVGLLAWLASGWWPFVLVGGLLAAALLYAVGRALWLRHRVEPVPRR